MQQAVEKEIYVTEESEIVCNKRVEIIKLSNVAIN